MVWTRSSGCCWLIAVAVFQSRASSAQPVSTPKDAQGPFPVCFIAVLQIENSLISQALSFLAGRNRTLSVQRRLDAVRQFLSRSLAPEVREHERRLLSDHV